MTVKDIDLIKRSLPWNFDPFTNTQGCLRTPTAIQFPGNCAFTIIAKLDRLPGYEHALSGRASGAKTLKKEIEKQCDLPAELGFSYPPTGSFLTLNYYQKTLIQIIEDLGFILLMEGIKNYSYAAEGSALVNVYYRPNPAHSKKQKGNILAKGKPLF